MATTHIKQRLDVVQDDAMLSLITRQLPEGASQTFVLNAPVAIASGYVVVFVAPTTAKLAGFAMSDGHNSAAGTDSVDVVLAVPGITKIEANFLGSAAADNVLAAADFGSKFDLASSSTLINGDSPGWYIADTTSDPSVRICQFPPMRVANTTQVRTAAGDTNARVYATPIATKTHWDDV